MSTQFIAYAYAVAVAAAVVLANIAVLPRRLAVSLRVAASLYPVLTATFTALVGYRWPHLSAASLGLFLALSTAVVVWWFSSLAAVSRQIKQARVL